MNRHHGKTAVIALVLAVLAGLGVIGLALYPGMANGPTTPDIERVVHSYIVGHPEVLQEAVAVLRKRQSKEAADQDRKLLAENHGALYGSAGSVVAGNPDGDVTIIEFFDYNCPYCKEVFPTLERLQASDPNVRFLFREFPILAPSSLTASRAALAAVRQGRYVALHNALMSTPGHLSDEAIMDIAQRLGLDMNRLRTDMRDPAIDRALSGNLKLAQTLGLTGTPSFVIGDTILRGLASYDKLESLIKAARTDCKTCKTAQQAPAKPSDEPG